jgi:transcriptional regulator with XRE-family HTH domain
MGIIDRHVGSRVRQRRMTLGLSRTDLAAILEVSVESIRRFEAGEERIGAALLWLISEKLQVPVPYFFATVLPEFEEQEDEQRGPTIH